MKRKPNLKWLRGVDWEKGTQRDLAVVIAGACLLLIIASIGFDSLLEEEERAMPDFALINNVSERKAAFFEYMLPYVEEANYEILRQRDEIKRIESAFHRGARISRRDRAQIDDLLEEYKFDPIEELSEETFRHLLTRADEIPPSLALSQAALESAWGTSRFAKEGYNLFGMWCYDPGCGIVPSRRPKGKTYEVASYESPRDSFTAYFRNLNTNRYYLQMRAIRRAHRSQDLAVSGFDLAEGLDRYSQEGYQYISKVRSVIQSNKLTRFD